MHKARVPQKHSLQKGQSNESLQQSRLPSQHQPNSELTMSSHDRLNEDGTDDQHSIISEEDSAFEDQTPHQGLKKMKIQQFRQRNADAGSNRNKKNGSINMH